MIKSLIQNCDKNYLQKASYYILKDIVSIGSRKVNYKSIALSVCQVLPPECAQSLFLNLKKISVPHIFSDFAWRKLNINDNKSMSPKHPRKYDSGLGPPPPLWQR